MESLGTERKGAQRGAKGRKEAGRGLSPFLPPSPAIPSLVPLKKVKRALASLPPLGSFYLFTFLPFYL
ncbi:hypothetical protein DXB41_08925 [Segatella copri]|nr:hypothetical protein DXB41_08925 [Segatella copri]